MAGFLSSSPLHRRRFQHLFQQELRALIAQLGIDPIASQDLQQLRLPGLIRQPNESDPQLARRAAQHVVQELRLIATAPASPKSQTIDSKQGESE